MLNFAYSKFVLVIVPRPEPLMNQTRVPPLKDPNMPFARNQKGVRGKEAVLKCRMGNFDF